MAVVCALGNKQAAASLTVRLRRTVTLALRARAPTKRTHQPNKPKRQKRGERAFAPTGYKFTAFQSSLSSRKLHTMYSMTVKKRNNYPSTQNRSNLAFSQSSLSNPERTVPTNCQSPANICLQKNR